MTATSEEATGSLNGGASSSRPLAELTATTHVDGEIAPDSEGIPPTAHTGESPITFSRLNPDSIFTDTLSSAEGGSQDIRPTDQGEEGPAADGDGETADLMQRTRKRKRGSPQPAPRPAGSLSSWLTSKGVPARELHYPGWVDSVLFLEYTTAPRGTPRARGRGCSARPRPIIPKARPSPERRKFVRKVRRSRTRRVKRSQKMAMKVLSRQLQKEGDRPLQCQTTRRSSAGKNIPRD